MKFTPGQMKEGLRTLTPQELVALYNAARHAKPDEALSAIYSAIARIVEREEEMSRAG